MIAPLRERLQSMTFREKIDYLWEYYKLQFFAIIGAIIAVIYIISSVTGNKEPALNVVFVGETVNITAIDELNQQVNEAIIPEEERDDQEISLQFVNLSEAGGPQQSMAEVQKFTTLLAADAYDVIIAEEETFEMLSGQGALADLNRVANLDEINTGGHETVDSDTGQPVAIHTEEMEVIDEVIAIENSYLFLPNNPQNQEYIQPFIQFLVEASS